MFSTLDLVEFVKDPYHLIFGYADSGIPYLMKDMLISPPGHYGNLTSVPGKFEGIGEEVNEDVMKPISICNDRKVLRNAEADGEALVYRLDLVNVSFHHLGEEDRLWRKGEST